MKLYPFQVEWLARIDASLDVNLRVIMQGTTGCGKTVVAAHMMARYVSWGLRCLFVVHRQELVDQAVLRLKERGEHRVGIILSGTREDLTQPIQVASIQTLTKRGYPEADIIFVDEAHHAAAKTWMQMLEYYKGKSVIGLTATPLRLDGRPLGDRFDDIVCAPEAEELFKLGKLAKPLLWSVPHAGEGLEQVKVSMGDYDLKDYWKKANRKVLVGDVIEHWSRLARDLPTVCYAVNIEHAKLLLPRFRAAGARAEIVTGKTPKDVRRRILADVQEGRLDVVINVMVVTEGWDAPNVRCCIMARGTMSMVLYRQMAGRVERPGVKQPKILDNAGNYIQHGLPWDVIPWSLTKGQKPHRRGTALRKTCPNPDCGSEVHLGAKECPYCGHEFWKSELPPEDVTRQLALVNGPSLREQAIERVRAGESKKSVAEALKVSPINVSYWCKMAGLTPPAVSISEQTVQQVRELLLTEKHQREIARIAGISNGAVTQIAKTVPQYKHRPRLSKEKQEKLLSLCLAGQSYHKIAEKLGVASAVVSRRARKAGLPLKHPYVPPIPQEKVQEAIRLAEKEKSLRKIASSLGISRDAVKKHLKTRGVRLVNLCAPRSSETKEKALQMCQEGKSKVSVCKAFSIGRETLRLWLLEEKARRP